MKEMLTRAIALGRHGALTRPVFGKPRGTRTQAAARKEPIPGHYYPGTAAWFIVLDEPLCLETYVDAMQMNVDDEMRRAAIAVIGEFGDSSCIAALDSLLHGDSAEVIRCCAADALASIGGEASLWRALESTKNLLGVRVSALISLLDLLTPDGWDNYNFMCPGRVVLPADVHARLLRVQGLANIANVVAAFDPVSNVSELS